MKYCSASEAEKDYADVLKNVAVEIAKELDYLGDFQFEHLNWEYEQRFHCVLGTTETLVECKLAERFLYAYWDGEYGKDDRLKDIVIRVNTDDLCFGMYYGTVGA